MAPSEGTLSYCGEQVRRNDRDRFLTCLFAPPERREWLFGLYAFNVEVAKTREVVSQPMLGQIRLQWWRDALDELYVGTVRAHEVLQSLAPAVATGRLERDRFEAVLLAREADLEEGPPPDMAALEAYADGSSGALALLALEALDAGSDAAATAARHAGIAWALTGLLRAVPYHARIRRIHLPADLMAAHGVSATRLFEGRRPDGLPAVAAAIGGVARAHVEAARAVRRGVGRAAMPVLLQAAMAQTYLGVLERAGWDPFAPRVPMAHPLLQLRLAWRAFIGRY
ncbi:phytoene/squalene synthase family protein [Arenibaculum pallidiluteum]|uniref:phytoene/squalene synthase family protein n=1 Tax=Arenibaculum pallidiluteum TaxID=2812559 RepID=UPI001A9625DB|nr:squalene/phytoene synthase family protein [Arenibaculum pallidiluteum]